MQVQLLSPVLSHLKKKDMEIKDYLHLYLNSVDVIIESVSDEYKSHFGHAPGHKTQLGPMLWMIVFEGHVKIKPILRKLSDMTEEECDKYGIAYLNGEYTKDCFEADATYGTTFKVYGIKSLSERVIQMCKDGWDLFGLIPAGLAIDKTSLKN